jgi:nucleoside-diphosphate-sugar epimerase
MIAVVGASGEIGARLMEQLLARGLPARALVRSHIGPRLSRHEIDVRYADLRDLEGATRALEGCEVVINCAVDKSPAARDSDHVRRNVAGCRNLLTAGQRAGVRRLVHLSSIAAMPPRVTAAVLAAPWVYSRERNWYTRSKIATEKLLRRDAGCAVCIVRPGIVYGPYMEWSRLAFSRCRDGIVCLPDVTPSCCYAVHVDDLTSLLELLATAPDPPPPLLYAVNPASVSWPDFYRAHGAAAGLPGDCVRLAPLAEIDQHIPRAAAMDNVLAWVRWANRSPAVEAVRGREWFESGKAALKRRLGMSDAPAATTTAAPPREENLIWPDAYDARVLQSDARFSPELVGGAEGFEHRVHLRDGCAQAAAWWQFAAPGRPELPAWEGA